MKTSNTCLLLGFAFLAGCAGTPAVRRADSTAYYFGTVKYSSLDGRMPFGKTRSAAKREISAGGALVVETVTEPGRSPSMPAQTFTTRITRRGETLVYDAADDEKTFTGTVTFSGPGLEAWTYDIKLVKGGELTGSGKLTPEGLSAVKVMAGPDEVKITEELKTVSQDEYAREIEEMRPPVGAE